MKKKYQNLFFIFGLVSIGIMLYSFHMDYQELWLNIRKAGYYLPFILLLWLVIYFINTASWFLIIRDGRPSPVSFAKVYKFTVSGFALNYVTPVGLMGGEPYRIMALTPYVGAERATSSVILFAMMHICSHFCFWLLALLLYVCLVPVTLAGGIIFFFIGLFCSAMLLLFMKGYKHGVAVAIIRVCGRIPFLKSWAIGFAERKKEQLETIDKQIALLHKQQKKVFYGSLFLELTARIVGCFEIWLILNILTSNISFLNCIYIGAFSSLLANLLFFMPMQLGGREGGFALAVGGLSISGAYGVYTALITRIRELFWITIGVLLIKIGNKK